VTGCSAPVLAGAVVTAVGGGPVVEAALLALSGLGATVHRHGSTPAGAATLMVTAPDPPPAQLAVARPAMPASPSERLPMATYRPSPFEGVVAPGLPDGVEPLARGLALAIGALVAALAGTSVVVEGLAADLLLWLPEVMAASYQAPEVGRPRPPVPAPGGGWVAADLASADDSDAFARMLDTVGPTADAEAVAATAQLWRLPVCPYRPRPPRRRGAPSGAAVGQPAPWHRPAAGGLPTAGVVPVASPAPAAGWPPLRGVVVCDLTAMWAGPLATWLLGRLGATVVKVEPACRRDGLRAFDGRGIHPCGVSRRTGDDSGLFNALNGGKQLLDADLTTGPGRERFEATVAEADLVVDSFSPRVRPNLELTRDHLCTERPDLLTLSLPAFGPGPQRSWVAYGTGVHATLGLGDDGTGGAMAPAVSYPDPVGGLGGALVGLAGLLARQRGWVPTHLEAPIAQTAALALELGDGPGTLGEEPGALGSRLLDAATDLGLVAEVADGAGRHRYPTGPLRGPVAEPVLGPAPALDPAPVNGPTGGRGGR